MWYNKTNGRIMSTTDRSIKFERTVAKNVY